MKRLKRKAGETVSLYHVTSSQYFEGVVNDGRISPSAELEQNPLNRRPNSNMTLYYATNEDAGGNAKEMEVPLAQLIPDPYNPMKNEQYSQAFLTEFGGKLAEVFSQFPDVVNQENEVGMTCQRILSGDYSDLRALAHLRDNEVDKALRETKLHLQVKKIENKGDEYIVSLSAQPNDAYLSRAVNLAIYDRAQPNFGVIMMIDVETDALSGDLYHGKGKIDYFDGSIPLWKQSLDNTGIVVHNGPIDVGHIRTVTFSSNNVNYNGDVQGFVTWAQTYIQFDTELTYGIAATGIKSLYDAIRNGELPTETQTTASRLRKRK